MGMDSVCLCTGAGHNHTSARLPGLESHQNCWYHSLPDRKHPVPDRCFQNTGTSSSRLTAASGLTLPCVRPGLSADSKMECNRPSPVLYCRGAYSGFRNNVVQSSINFPFLNFVVLAVSYISRSLSVFISVPCFHIFHRIFLKIGESFTKWPPQYRGGHNLLF